MSYYDHTCPRCGHAKTVNRAVRGGYAETCPHDGCQCVDGPPELITTYTTDGTLTPIESITAPGGRILAGQDACDCQACQKAYTTGGAA